MIAAWINPADNPLAPDFYRLLSHNFGPALAPFLVALAVTLALVPVTRWLSFRVGAVAEPGGRNIHARPTGRLGGLALAAGFLVAGLLFGGGGSYPGRQVAGLLVITAVTTALMAIDDIRTMRARDKFVLQVLLALAVPTLAGIRIGFVNLGGGHVVQLGLLLGVPLTVVWLLGMQNTLNLLDGVDGLAGGVAAIVALALLLAAVNREQSSPDQLTVVLLCAALGGACLGFLVFNFHPAKIFMGDSGAHFLGMALGILSIFGIAKGAVVFALFVPLTALLVPIADTGLAIVRRRRHGLSIAHPDTAHIHHQLLDFGLSQRQTCLVFYFATGITSGLGLMLFGHRKILAVVVVLLVIALSTILGDRLYELEFGAARPEAGAKPGELTREAG
ncbi:MAG TPA: MraY family glycosyltransferase [Candidatus Dormibacteraeota bacterium]|jgi:UDP-GlcNAc:undecaprenyl-phosphate GlcNAc-1-phosphate transferase|nr:MraY family glycosyltransferase [Candidatus Dormibacteraeota bacterium]